MLMECFGWTSLAEMGSFVHAVESEMLCASTDGKHVPYFNAPI